MDGQTELGWLRRATAVAAVAHKKRRKQKAKGRKRKQEKGLLHLGAVAF